MWGGRGGGTRFNLCFTLFWGEKKPKAPETFDPDADGFKFLLTLLDLAPFVGNFEIKGGFLIVGLGNEKPSGGDRPGKD